jgi:DNA-binding response OmpR family regulator
VLLVLDASLVNNDAERLEVVLLQAQLSCAVLCLGPAPFRAAFLSRGADAYVTDRASLSEVLSHATRLLEAAQARSIGESGVQRPARSVLEVGPLLIELLNRRVFVDHEVLKLRPAEFEVLVYLALNRHRTVSATEIVRDALDTFGDGSSARNQLFELRRKLREVGLGDAILTERGRGYRLVL